MTRQIKLAVTVLISAITGAYLGFNFNSPTQPLHTHQTTTTDSELALYSTIQRLEDENKALRQRLAMHRVSAKSSAITTAPLAGKELADNPQNAPITHAVPSSEHFAPSENFSRWLEQKNTSSPDFNLDDEMRRRFDAEEIDPDWAETQASEYASLFIDSEELSGFAFKDAQCKSTQCAISVGITNIEQANQLVEKISTVLKHQQQYPLIISVPDTQRGTSTVYIGKGTNSFEFN